MDRPSLQTSGDAMEHSKRAIQTRRAKDMIAKAVLSQRMCYNFSWAMYRSDLQAQEGCFYQISILRVHILFSPALQCFYGCYQSFYVLLFSHTLFVSTLDLAADCLTTDLMTNSCRKSWNLKSPVLVLAAVVWFCYNSLNLNLKANTHYCL